jgi:hypothetical protein
MCAQGSLIQYFVGRYHMVCGRMQLCQQTLQRAISAQNELHQMRHLCYWEMM